jgi:hypothetical protein
MIFIIGGGKMPCHEGLVKEYIEVGAMLGSMLKDPTPFLIRER